MKSRFLDELDPALLTTDRAGNGRAPHRHGAVPVQRPTRVREEHPGPIDPVPNYEDESQEQSELRVGSRVLHESFGGGKVIALDGRGERARAIVEFDSVGRKHLMLKFAHLRSS